MSQYRQVIFSTSDVPESNRLAYWHDFFGEKVIRCELVPQGKLAFHAKATIYPWPGLCAVWYQSETPATARRVGKILADGDESCTFFINCAGTLALAQRGHDTCLGPGDAATILHAEPATVRASALTYYVALVVPRATLASFPCSFKGTAMSWIPERTEALCLLRKYLEITRQGAESTTPELLRLAVSHIHDLMALAIGTDRARSEMTARRGVAMARLSVIKNDIIENIGNIGLSVTKIAARHRVTPRYIHMLFEIEGVSFSEFVLENRLIKAHRMITNPLFFEHKISDIAFSVGFSDLSQFNRNFRRRYGMTPSALRNGRQELEPEITNKQSNRERIHLR
jgi:AraC-like DNA-binding protein